MGWFISWDNYAKMTGEMLPWGSFNENRACVRQYDHKHSEHNRPVWLNFLPFPGAFLLKRTDLHDCSFASLRLALIHTFASCSRQGKRWKNVWEAAPHLGHYPKNIWPKMTENQIIIGDLIISTSQLCCLNQYTVSHVVHGGGCRDSRTVSVMELNRDVIMLFMPLWAVLPPVEDERWRHTLQHNCSGYIYLLSFALCLYFFVCIPFFTS